MFAELYGNYVERDFRATEEYSDRDIQKAVIMHEGDSIPGFPSIDAFLYLLQPQLERLGGPAVELLSFVYQYLEELAVTILNKLFNRFPRILDLIVEVTIKHMQHHREKTRKIVEQVIESECSYLYTTDLGYLTQRGGSFPRSEDQRGATSDPIIRELRARIDSYFIIVCRNVRDSVPKIIGTYLVRACQDDLQFALYDEINRNELFLEALNEPESIAMERKTLLQTQGVLQKSVRAIKKDPDLSKQVDLNADDDNKKREKPVERNAGRPEEKSRSERDNSSNARVTDPQPQHRRVDSGGGRPFTPNQVNPGQPQMQPQQNIKNDPVFPPAKTDPVSGAKPQQQQQQKPASSGWKIFS
jgi:hypothetical protein